MIDVIIIIYKVRDTMLEKSFEKGKTYGDKLFFKIYLRK